MTRLPYSGRGRAVQSGGELATRKQDFNAHWQGGGFRQGADTVDMNPPLAGSLYALDVQATLEKFQTYLTGLSVITIGDGYTTSGDFTVGTIITPTIEDCFTAALATSRLSRGGWILMKSGRYDFVDTVTLPYGISIMGSVGGTILNAMPALGLLGKPMFSVNSSHSYELGAKWSPPAVYYMSDGYLKNKFVNLSFTDNLDDGYTFTPAISASTSAFIRIRNDSHVEVDSCVALGRTKYGSGAGSAASTNFIKLIDTNPAAFGNNLTVKNCMLHGFQKIVDFGCTVTFINKFNFSNNRVWFFDASASTTVFSVSTNACDCTFVGNRFKFTPLNSANLAVVPVCFEVSGSPSDVVDINVENNVMDSDFLINDEQNQLLRFNDPLNTNAGSNKRFNVKGNITGGVSSSDWFMTIGDGENSVGDLNGAKALVYLSNIYSNLFAVAPGAVNYCDQITVFIKPGYYYIDSGYNTNGIGTKLIGLVENGNIPRIEITNPVNAAPGGITLDASAINVILGTHIENLNIQHRLATYVRLVSFVGLNNPATYESYSERYVAKNCTFLNCGLYPRTLTSMGTRNLQSILDIVGCRFYAAAGHSDVSIILDQSIAKINIDSCSWEKSNGGLFFAGHAITNVYGWNGETNESDISITNCSFTFDSSTAALIDVSYAAINLAKPSYFKFENNILDISSTTSKFDYMLYLDGGLADSTCIITRNKFIGNNSAKKTDATAPVIGVRCSSASSIAEISQNSFYNVPKAMELLHENAGATTQYSVAVKNNVYDSGTKGSIFCDFYDTAVHPDIGELIVKENSIRCSNQNTALVLDSTLSATAENTGVITISYNVAGGGSSLQAIVNDNNIYTQKITANITGSQAAIVVNGAASATINGNKISAYQSSASAGYFIVVSMFDGATETRIDNSSCYVKNNTGYLFKEAATGDFIGVYCRNINYINVVENTLITDGDEDITIYVKAYSDPAYTAKMDGNIINNIFSKSLAMSMTFDGSGDITGETFTKEVVMHDETTTFDTRIRSEFNKNQKAVIDIYSTEFLKYGLNQENAEPIGVMLRDTNLLLSDAEPSNINLHRQHIMASMIGSPGDGDEVAFGGWAALPSGLYYSNTWRAADNFKDPMIETIDGYHFQNQILIPLNVPNNCEIVRIDIPIYFKNLDGANPITVETSASWIFGNAINDTGGYNYIRDLSNATAPSNMYLWEKRTSTIGAGSTASFRLINYTDTVAADTLVNESWINSNTGVPYPKTYVLLALNRVSEVPGDETARLLAFAIPYARLVIKY